MRIGTCISKKGKITSGSLKVSYQGKKTKLPIKIIEGDSNDKVAFISAGLHGDELNGINIVSNFLNKVDPKNLHGTIIVVPILNPIGFHYGERRIRYDGKDLNRCFGKQVDSFSKKLAKTFFDNVVSISDFGMDFHDSNKRYILLPHTRIFSQPIKELDEMSRSFGTEIVMKRKTPTRGMLAVEALKKHKIPILTVEIGGGMNILPQYVNEGVRGLNSVLSHKGFIDHEVVVPEKQFILSDRLGYRSSIEGILNTNKKLGNIIEKKETIGNVFSPVSEKKLEIKAHDPGILFSIKATSHIKANERAFSLLHFKKQRGDIVPTEGKMIINKATSQIHVYTSGVFNKATDIMKKHSTDFFKALLME